MSHHRQDLVHQAIEETVRNHWSRTLSALVYRIRDLQLAEDALQDATLAAWKQWPSSGIPDSPQAWLYRIALRRAIDQIRRQESFASKQAHLKLLAEHQTDASCTQDLDTEFPDERLRLIFTCCHPALERNASVALTLRAIAGLETREIAAAFLVEETTLAQRLVRAKRKIRDAGIPYRVPPPELWNDRLEAVLAVLYFIFNEGYRSSTDPSLIRTNLCREAIRLTRTCHALLPKESELAGLLALMLLHDARREARQDASGAFIPLEQQDRSLWDRSQIEEGDILLRDALTSGPVGPYQIQAAVSAIHANAHSWEATDWPQIVHLYRTLYRSQPSPVVRLNEAVAISMIQGPEAALDILDQLTPPSFLENYQPFHAARADFLRRAGRLPEAAAAYTQAIALTANPAETEFLTKQRSRCIPDS